MRKKKEALSTLVDFQERLTSDPTNAELRQALAGYLVALGYGDQAIQEYELCAKLYVAHGELSSALRCAKQILQISPKKTEILSFLTRAFAADPDRDMGIARPIGEKKEGLIDSFELSVLSLEVDIQGILEELDREEEAFEEEETLVFSAPEKLPLSRVDLEDETVVIEDGALPPMPLFTALGAEAFASSIKATRVIEIDAERHLNPPEQGALFLLLKGSIQVEATREKGGKQILRRLSSGDLLGELTLMSGFESTLSWQTLTRCELMVFEQAALQEAMRTHIVLHSRLFTIYAQNLVHDALALNDLFSSLVKSEREKVAKRFKTREYDPGEVVVHAGDRTPGLFLVLDGNVQVEEAPMITLFPGDFFGIVGIFLSRPFQASVVAKGPATLLFLSTADFLAALEEMPEAEDALDAKTVVDGPLHGNRRDYSPSGLSRMALSPGRVP